MRSSSTEARAGAPLVGRSGRRLRLTLVGLLAAGALAAPVLGTTGALYSDRETAGFDVLPPTPTTSPTEPAPTGTPAAAETPTEPPPSPTPTPTRTE